eukprot:scaffold10401_cov65-Phaeocystis_antarctica.AAC.5
MRGLSFGHGEELRGGAEWGRAACRDVSRVHEDIRHGLARRTCNAQAQRSASVRRHAPRSRL